jgi:hypothetical protein
MLLNPRRVVQRPTNRTTPLREHEPRDQTLGVELVSTLVESKDRFVPR